MAKIQENREIMLEILNEIHPQIYNLIEPYNPNFLFEAPTFTPLSNEAKVLYAFILRRTELSRKNGWADEYGRIYLYYPICEVVALLHCGRQKAVNTLRELQYAGLVEIQKQGCGKPNCIYPKSYEAVSNTDFKKSRFGTPEG